MERNIFWICLLAFMALTIEGIIASTLLTKDTDIPEAMRHKKQTAKFSCTIANKEPGIRLVWSKLANNNKTQPKTLSMDSTITTRKNPNVGNNQKKFEILTTQDVAKNLETYTLVIRDIELLDNGSYQCMLMVRNVSHLEYPRARGRLLVLVAPKVTPTVPIVTAEEGENVTLDCNIQGSPWPQITWSHDTYRPLHSGAMVSQGNPYTIMGIVRSDAGGYYCSAQNGVKPNAQATVTVKVLFKPEIKAIASQVGQVSGKNKWSELRCSVASNPAAVLSWHFETESGLKEVKNTPGKYEITTANIEALLGEKQIHFILKILNVSDSDYGNYTCKAVNRFGNGDDGITVFETKTCQGPSCENYKPTPKTGCSSNAKLCVHIKNSGSTFSSSMVLIAIAAVLALVHTNNQWHSS
ncbi:protein amalgam-like isoform X2 [Lineus longissimus]|uniref:protein amalgam-like isoform X2 n=1 Tax=Lineus longissimus TaxID=88925 RepID=UPI002B4E257F